MKTIDSFDCLYFEQELNVALVNKDSEKALDTISLLTSIEKPKMAKDKIQSLKNYYTRLFGKVEELLKVSSQNPLTLHAMCIKHVNTLDELDSISEIENYVYDNFKEIFSVEDEQSDINHSNLMKETLKYIKKNISQELSLDLVANHLNVHPAYLSTNFKKKMNMNFIDYINSQRIKESTKLLLYSDKSITDIALHLGYCNSSYYSALFKKIMKETPKQYRSKYKNDFRSFNEIEQSI